MTVRSEECGEILLLETPCPSVGPVVRNPPFLPHIMRTLTTSLRGSHGLSARRVQRTESSRPEGPPIRSWDLEGP